MLNEEEQEILGMPSRTRAQKKKQEELLSEVRKKREEKIDEIKREKVQQEMIQIELWPN